MKRDIKSNLKIGHDNGLLVKTETDKTAYSTAIDTKGMKSLAIGLIPIDVDTGLFYTKSAYDDVDLILQDSDDNVNFKDVDSEKQIGDLVFSSGSELDLQKIGLVSNERYVRVKAVGNTLGTLANNKLNLRLVYVSEMYERPVE